VEGGGGGKGRRYTVCVGHACAASITTANANILTKLGCRMFFPYSRRLRFTPIAYLPKSGDTIREKKSAGEEKNPAKGAGWSGQ